MSMEHMRPTLGRAVAAQGDALHSNRRRAILTMVEDTSPGRHDTIIAACDDYRYGLLGCTEYHDNCTDNLIAAMRQLGIEVAGGAEPAESVDEYPVAPDGAQSWGEPLSKPGDYVVLRAEMDCIVAMSGLPAGYPADQRQGL
jgi:uncharacterized protein YcgI (DUF1989 family)